MHGSTDGSFFRLVKVRNEIHHVLVQILQKSRLGDLLQTCFRVTHGSRTISFDISEITVTVYQRLSLFEILSHHNKRIIDRAVAVRMIFTHRVSDDTGALSIGSVRAYPQLVHIVKHTALNGF